MQQQKLSVKGTSLLALSALGIILGDIGTSPLYAFKEMMHTEHLTRSLETILGGLSLFFWALILIGTVQYCWVFIKVHYDGEGGSLALYAILKKASKDPKGLKFVILIGIALTIADGIITPPISVMSAVEGISILYPNFDFVFLDVPATAWIAIVILVALFSVQRFGTEQIGRLFGPIMLLWFLSIGGMGLTQIIQSENPWQIFQAINPYWAVVFLADQNIWDSLEILGRVALCVTGAEALYADRGHFTQPTIRIAWYTALPCLILNYFGQGALALSGATVENGNFFYGMCSSRGILIYMVLIATLATIIASQAMITGTFSLMKMAVNFDLCPRLRIIHTNPEHRTQIYLPMINIMLGIGAVAMVLIFKNSSNIASAYGISVFGAMVVTTSAYCFVSQRVLKQNRLLTLILAIMFFSTNGLFLIANSMKFFTGGYISVIIALFFTWVMFTWQWGQNYIYTRVKILRRKTIAELYAASDTLIKRPCILACLNPIYNIEEEAPLLLVQWWERYFALPEKMIFLYVHPEPIPYVNPEDKVRFLPIKNELVEKGMLSPILQCYSLEIFYGYMEEVELPETLESIKGQHGLRKTTDWMLLWQEWNFVEKPESKIDRYLLNFFILIQREASKYINILNIEKKIKTNAVQVEI